MKCPKCTREAEFVQKDTSSGRELRTYHCPACKEWVTVDDGVALWKVLRDARKQG
jgi:hypothetical protein